MSIIAPCITVDTEEKYKAAVEKIQPFAERVQIDVSDGLFAPIALVPPEKLWWPSNWMVDIHAMVKSPTDYVDKLIELKPHMIIFHAEADANLMPIFMKIKQFGIKTGVALLKTTVPSSINDIIRQVDHVLVFSGDLGHYGGKASLLQLQKVRLIKKMNPAIEIGWDGGVSLDNAFTLSSGGVDVLNVGGAIANVIDPNIVYAKLNSEISKHGVI